jgi:hypothetical protein
MTVPLRTIVKPGDPPIERLKKTETGPPEPVVYFASLEASAAPRRIDSRKRSPPVHAGAINEAAGAARRLFYGQWNRPVPIFVLSREVGSMAYAAILRRIRLLIPADRDGHYNAVRRGFEEGDLTAPSLSISDIELARALSEFMMFPPNEASIETLERRLNPQH